MNITEKIIVFHSENSHVSPGELVEVEVDMALANDITAPLSIRALEKHGINRIADPNRIALVADHNTPCKDIASAENVALMRRFARTHTIPYFFEGGEVGIEHVLLPERGLVIPGDLVVGADSHTCTYGALSAFSTGMGSTDIAGAWALGRTWLKVPESIKFLYKGNKRPFVTGKDLILYTIGEIGVDGARYCAMEFCGPVISSLSMDERFTMANMAIEAGAKNGIMEADNLTLEYVSSTGTTRQPVVYSSDPDAEWKNVYQINTSFIEPQVALPHLPENTRSVYAISRTEISQAVIGSCTNGRIDDLRMAASVLKSRSVNPGVRLYIFPGSPSVLMHAEREGLVKIFLRAGAVLCPPSCGPCLGGHLGVLAAGERSISTTNRNFIGRMGHPESEVYLSNPFVAAASAVAGYITAPDKL